MRTYWDHITGEAVHGPLVGRQLETWPVTQTSVAGALAETPALRANLSGHRSLRAALMNLGYRLRMSRKGYVPPFFRRTMQDPDRRLPELTLGLGVVEGRRARYYPVSALRDGGVEEDWAGRMLAVRRNKTDGVPFAGWVDTGARPFQLLSRWYGFSYTYPGCEVYAPPG